MEQIQNNRVITDLYRENAQFPGIALDGSDVYLCWQRFVDRHDSLMASCRRGDEVVWEREISDGGEVLHPVILAHGGAIWYAWSEYARENWRILARCYRDGQWGEVLTVASGEALFFPRLFTWQGRLHVIWTEQHKGSAAAVLCPLTEAGPGAAETVSVVGEAYRAGAAEGGDGNLYVAYDGFDGKQYKLFARARTAAGWSEEIVVSQGEDWASTPWIAAKPTAPWWAGTTTAIWPSTPSAPPTSPSGTAPWPRSIPSASRRAWTGIWISTWPPTPPAFRPWPTPAASTTCWCAPAGAASPGAVRC